MANLNKMTLGSAGDRDPHPSDARKAPSTWSPLMTRPLHYLALGDSYTIGESVAPTERWPVQLTRRLRDSGVAIDDPTLVARTGWTTDELAAGLTLVRLRPHYDLVSLLIGVNNQYRGRDVESFRGEFRQLLDRAIRFAAFSPRRVLVLGIPDWGVTPFAKDRDQAKIAREIDAYNEAKQKICEQAGVSFIDIAEVSRRAASDADLVAEDGLHPSGALYRLWVEQAWEAAQAIAALGPATP